MMREVLNIRVSFSSRLGGTHPALAFPHHTISNVVASSGNLDKFPACLLALFKITDVDLIFNMWLIYTNMARSRMSGSVKYKLLLVLVTV